MLAHLHDKAFVMAATSLRDELIFETSTLLIELHHWILAMFCQNGALLPCALKEKGGENVVFQTTTTTDLKHSEQKRMNYKMK